MEFLDLMKCQILQTQTIDNFSFLETNLQSIVNLHNMISE